MSHQKCRVAKNPLGLGSVVGRAAGGSFILSLLLTGGPQCKLSRRLRPGDALDSDSVLKQVEIKEGLEGLTPASIATLYRRAPLLRQFADLGELWEAYEKSSLVLTAWYQGRLVGVARVLTDGALFSYLCDLAVEPDVQRLGIGRTLIDEIITKCQGTDIVLRDSSGSTSYYPKIGFKKAGNAWVRSA